MEFFGWILLIVLAAALASLYRRLAGVEQRLGEQISARAAQDQLLGRLVERIRILERGAEKAITPVPSPVPSASPSSLIAPPPLPAESQPLPPALAPAAAGRFCQFCGRTSEPGAAICVCGAVLDPTRIPPPLPAPVEPEPEAVPPPISGRPPEPERASWSDRLRDRAKAQEWEAVVGGSWLNKLGVLVLVIGIALFLGYAFTRMGPSGRVGIGIGVSLALLLGGIVIERKPLYRIVARGLIGGGWAALYFTTYAMHAVPAAAVIDNPYLATVLLLAVASGMILHSLRYRSQTVSGLAYFIAFATLSMSGSTTFSVLALIPLAASLLYLAYRFDWLKMAVLGVAATYAACASRPDTGAPLASTQALFVCYWLLFEIFDLLRLRRRTLGFTAESLIFPLNALGFLGLSLVKWHRAAPEYFYAALAAGAALFLIGALLRVRISGARLSGYQSPLTVAAALAAWSILSKATGMWINVSLLIEAELLFLAGLGWGEAYPRWLAGAVFLLPVGKLVGIDVPAGGTRAIGGRSWMTWTPAAMLTAAVFYINRVLRSAGGFFYSSAAGAVVLLVLGFETPLSYLCVAWLIFGALLFELGCRTGKREFRWQSYAALLLGTGAGALAHSWLPLGIAAALHYSVALRARFAKDGIFPGNEREMAQRCTSLATSGFLAAAVWRLAPSGFAGVGWLILGAVLFELGLRRLPSQLRRQSYFVSAAGFANVFLSHVVAAQKGSDRTEWLPLALAALLCAGMSARLFPANPDRIAEEERGWARDLNAAAASLFLATLAWLELPPPLVALAWAVMAVVALEIGFAAPLERFRTLGNLITAAVIGRVFLANLTDFGETAGISHRILTVVPIVVSQYYLGWRYRASAAATAERIVARLYLYAPPVLFTLLLRFELGRTLTVVGWALFMLGLYALGVKRNLPDLRWQSYFLAALAFWRSWDTNFYITGSLMGIGGRVLTGAVVIACLYAGQLVAPRKSALRWERHARSYYSLLASVLLAVLLYYEVSGGLLTVAWSAEGLALLAAGFPLSDRFQRLSGLSLFLLCVLKLFLYDLRKLDTLSRILSFIALGAILVSVSFIYTRFRERLQRYL